MPFSFQTDAGDLSLACADYWHRYYESMRELHSRQGRGANAAIKDRNLGTTDSKHIVTFEKFWRKQLSDALGVDASEVGPRRVRFNAHRTKAFDVCWPLTDEPKILISIKSMQNAYRNFTNRIEEAFGDSAVLRLYRKPAAFGFFFFMLDGRVPRGLSVQGKSAAGHAVSGKGKGIPPHLDLIEEGGDFFSLAEVDSYRKEVASKTRGRQDTIKLAEQSLLDLAADAPTKDGGIHYDAIAFTPTMIKRKVDEPMGAVDWGFAFSEVNPQLHFKDMIARLLNVAELRGFL